MIRGFLIAVVVTGCLSAGEPLRAQSPAGGKGAASDQNSQTKQSGDSQKPAGGAQPANANPFPEDTSSVPVLAPTSDGAPAAGGNDGGAASFASLPSDDTDPVRSPDDPVAAAPSSSSGESSSLSGDDVLQPVPDDEKQETKRKLEVKEPTHQEGAAEDLEVGGYYLEKKNWKAALSRYQSALVLDPENPDVYWGLAEAERNLGQYADARANFQKVLDYDPDSRHGKQARKELKDPALAAAQSSQPGQSKPVSAQ